jgi:hypothetical protein
VSGAAHGHASGLAGYDPYDALRGTRVPEWVKRNGTARQATIQFRKRCPVNLAPLLGIRPFVMAKAAASFLTAQARSILPGDRPDDEERQEARALVQAMRSAEGNLGDGAWGYEFDVQTRWAYYPAGTPNVVATTFAAMALLEAGIVFGEDAWIDEGVRAGRFVSCSLLVREAARAWVRYTPGSDRLIHNASLLGASVLAAAGAVGGYPQLLDDALAVARTSVRAQEESGRWPYGEGADVSWADNFHSAYSLSALITVWHATGDPDVLRAIQRGASYWGENFFDADAAPRYFDRRSHPYDIHSAATAVETAVRLGEVGVDMSERARGVARWTERNLLAADGTTFYRRHRAWTDHRHFVRWGDGHWAVARATRHTAEAGAAATPLALAIAAAARAAGGVEGSSGE